MSYQMVHREFPLFLLYKIFLYISLHVKKNPADSNSCNISDKLFSQRAILQLFCCCTVALL